MNTQDDAETYIFTIVAVKKDLIPAFVTRDKTLRNDLHVDSMEELEIIMDVEDFFHIEIPDEDSEGLMTVGDLIDDVNRRVHR